jgi:hypothetical protein
MTSTDLPAIDPKRTALLVMDVQNGIIGSIADPGPYRFRTRRIGSELRFGVVSRLGQDHGSVCCGCRKSCHCG